MSQPKIRYEAKEGIARITLVDPPANTYSYAMMRELDAAILDARMDAAVHVLLIRGEGEKFFCAGADIKMLTEADPAFKYNFCLHANETLCRLEQTPKVVIAALNGHCVGGGLEIALACDLRLAKADGGKIGLPEINLGVLPGTGGTFAFDEALALGLVTEILPEATFDAEVAAYAARFVPPARASKAAGLIKRAVVSGLEAGFAEGLAIERELQQRLFESEDAREGLAAYIERRPPSFRGR
jgi:enoyl-CoA hydratase